MKENKLVSMVDFVLEQNKFLEIITDNYTPPETLSSNIVRLFLKQFNYANFLKKLLELGQFIACKDGVPLEEPNPKDFDDTKWDYQAAWSQWNEAKSLVLFEGLEAISFSNSTDLGIRKLSGKFQGDLCMKENGKFCDFDNDFQKLKMIDDLTGYDLTLTETAMKLI